MRRTPSMPALQRTRQASEAIFLLARHAFDLQHLVDVPAGDGDAAGDRIELVRGPGAALWGANAVNGVINVVTRSAAPNEYPAMNQHVSRPGKAERQPGKAERLDQAAVQAAAGEEHDERRHQGAEGAGHRAGG